MQPYHLPAFVSIVAAHQFSPLNMTRLCARPPRLRFASSKLIHNVFTEARQRDLHAQARDAAAGSNKLTAGSVWHVAGPRMKCWSHIGRWVGPKNQGAPLV